ncbi:acetyltransferase [Vibrio galatheae]|uniref:Acetyltransferase n=1 Tax=Vibrio galatheae TaxID=579748 RepID=A0A0F4NMC8_9VIBR|nr:GNAT family N-acetyltransferase [Vibrio galatheae]KJY84039.1 acetyltransferase [Vibrio galatheae]
MHTIKSQRLTLRMVNHQDAAFINELYNSEDFIKYVGDKQIRCDQDAIQYIDEKILAMHREYGVCLLLVEVSETNEKLGVCGLIRRPELEAYDIGYGFKPSAYGKGYGYEAASAVIDYAREQASIKDLVAITTSDNLASRALLSKLGFTYVKVQDVLSDTVDLILYQLTICREQ